MKKMILIGLSLIILSGCAGGLNSMQKREYVAFQNDGVLIEEKSPNTGALLGILPGFGSFYAREPAYGIINLLVWPFSIIWDPISGYNGSMAINYDITKHHLKKEKEKELSALEDRFIMKELDNSTYLLEKRKIDQKYNY